MNAAIVNLTLLWLSEPVHRQTYSTHAITANVKVKKKLNAHLCKKKKM